MRVGEYQPASSRRSSGGERLRTLTLLSAAVLCLCCAPTRAWGDSFRTNVVCRQELAHAHRSRLAEELRRITGWAELSFGDGCALLAGGEAAGGSRTARELLTASSQARDLIIVEDASRRADVVFARVVPGRWRNGREGEPPAHVLLLDFADFAHLRGDRAARGAFNAGWALLHEVAHVVRGLDDGHTLHEAGPCETFVNQMRREVGAAERASYFFTPLPGQERSDFKTKYVRLAFDRHDPSSNRKRRVWLMWDADAVGEVREPRPNSGAALTR